MLMLVIESEVRNQRSEVRRQSNLARFPISGIKSNSRFGRRNWEGWRIDDVHDSLQNRDDDSLVNIESLFQFFFQRGKFLSQAALVPEQRTHLEERANDKHAHLHGAWTIQHVCCHNRSVFSECIR